MGDIEPSMEQLMESTPDLSSLNYDWNDPEEMQRWDQLESFHKLEKYRHDPIGPAYFTMLKMNVLTYDAVDATQIAKIATILHKLVIPFINKYKDRHPHFPARLTTNQCTITYPLERSLVSNPSTDFEHYVYT